MRNPNISRVLLLVTTLALPASVCERAPLASDAGSAESPHDLGSATLRVPSYHFFSNEKDVWAATNDTQRLWLLLTTEEMRLIPSERGGAAWEWVLSLSRDGDPGDLRDSEFPAVVVEKSRADIFRGRVDEWLINGPEGIRHGIEISRPGESGILHFEFTLGGSLFPKVSEDGGVVEFRDRSGIRVLAYRDLSGTDAEGRDVAVRWERLEGRPGGGDLRLVVHDGDHALPIRVMALLAADEPPSGAPVPPATDFGALAVPTNDQCAGSQVVPGTGPFPYLTSTVDITDAGTAGDPPTPSCQPDVSRSVWYSFTPVTTADYTFSVCSGEPTAATVDDTVLAIYASSGPCTGFTELAGGCDDDSCPVSALQSVIANIRLTAGVTYHIVAWKYGSTAPAPGAGSIQLQVDKSPPPGPAPANDLCDDAELIPPDGPFPYLSAVAADISAATTTGEPVIPSCQPFVSRSIWYTFTPAAGGRYAFSLCADAPTATTVDDTVVAIYAGGCSAPSEVAAACDDDSCASESAQSVIHGVSLDAGTTYHVGVWQCGADALLPGNTAVQLRVSQVLAPPNDTCGSASSLYLDNPARGTTVSALDNHRLPAGSGCFAGVGQVPSTAPGADVVYRFVAPSAGKYSFRVTGVDTASNAVIYVSSDCPAGAPPADVAGCLGAANRNATRAEEVKCLALSALQPVYVYVDEHTATTGSAFTLEVNRCEEESEPNDSPGAALEPLCGVEGSIAPAGDADFFALGIPEAGARVFALVDGVAGNSTDFDLRVTTDADTLEYDDLNNDVPFGAVSPNTSGTPLGGAASYLRVSHYSAAAQAEPYRLYAAIRQPAGSATPEAEPNDTIATATGGAAGYYYGMLSDPNDVDIFSFSAAAGELVQIGLDLDPGRDATTFPGSLALLDASGATLEAVNDLSSSASAEPGSGNLTATTPSAPAEGIVYRMRSDGTYYAKVDLASGTPGDYLLSIAHECRVGPPTDIEVTQGDTPDPAQPGEEVTYAIIVRNLGANPASAVRLRDDPPAAATLISATPSQGTCAGSAPAVCHLGTLAAGASATVSVRVLVPGSPGSLENLARASTAMIDVDSGNNALSETTQVGSAPDGDGDGVPDAGDCAPADATAWAIPSEAESVIFPLVADPHLLGWSPPSGPCGTIVRYDLLRSTAAGDFATAACAASNVTTTSASDPAVPVPGTVFYYLVRAENVCGGSLGSRSDGTPRTGRACP